MTMKQEVEKLIECPRCLFTSDIAEIGNGQCNYCDLHDQLGKQSQPHEFEKALSKIRNHKKQYDCIIGISGGLDSSVLLYAAVKYWDLRPLVIHFDNGWNSAEAKNNMDQLVKKLNVNLITYSVDAAEYELLNNAFLSFGLPDADIPNDIAMTKLMYDTADKYGIKWILNGHDFRTEGSTPAKWTYMDARYIADVYRKYTGKELKNYPMFTFWDQIKYGLKGIKQIRPFHYNVNREAIEYRMKREIDWQDYGGKHAENIYTEFIGSYVLPVHHKIDKRIVYLSARIRSGMLTKEKARQILSIDPVFDLHKLGKKEDFYLHLAESEQCSRLHFDRYNFRKWKLVIWLLAKMKIVPFTFYKKYCSK